MSPEVASAEIRAMIRSRYAVSDRSAIALEVLGLTMEEYRKSERAERRSLAEPLELSEAGRWAC